MTCRCGFGDCDWCVVDTRAARRTCSWSICRLRASDCLSAVLRRAPPVPPSACRAELNATSMPRSREISWSLRSSRPLRSGWELRTTLFTMHDARSANLRVESDSWKLAAAGDSVASRNVLQLPPSESFSR